MQQLQASYHAPANCLPLPESALALQATLVCAPAQACRRSRLQRYAKITDRAAACRATTKEQGEDCWRSRPPGRPVCHRCTCAARAGEPICRLIGDCDVMSTPWCELPCGVQSDRMALNLYERTSVLRNEPYQYYYRLLQGTYTLLCRC